MANARSVMVTLSANVAGFRAGMAQAANSVDTVINKTTGASRAIDSISRTSLIAGGLVAAGLGVVVNSAANFDQAMSGVAATGQDAKNNLDALRETAMRLGADTQYSATEAANGITEMGKAGMSAADIMSGGLQGALDLASAGQMQVADAAELTATALNQFQLSGDQASHVADLLAAGAGKAQGNVSDLGNALKYAGIPASQLGISIEETTGTLAAFASQGIIGEQAGTSLRSMLMSLTAPTKAASKVMDEYGISLYDSNGKFIGLTATAGVLQDKLAGLDDATRNAALGQIFGNEAIGAANVLMQEGASGIKQWTAAVDEQGFAAEQASTKMDNLKGDLELLKGSLETAFIGTGSGAQAGLRDMLQGVTGLVDRYNELSPAAQKAAFQVAAVGTASLLAVGGIAKTVSVAGDAVANIKALGEAFAATGIKAATARSAMLNLGLAGASIGAAFLLLGPVYQKTIDKIGFVETQANDTYTAMARLGQGGQLAMYGLNAEIAAADFGSLQWASGSVNDLTGAFEQFKAVGTGGLGVLHAGIAGVASAFQALGLPVKTTRQELEQLFGQMDTALSAMDSGQAATAFDAIATSADAAGISVDDLMGQFSQYEANLSQVAAMLGQTNLSQQDMYNWMRGNVPSAVSAAADALGLNVTAMQNLAAATSSTSDAMQAYSSAALQQSGSLSGMYAAMDAAAKQAKKSGDIWDDSAKKIDLTTEAGRAGNDALVALAASATKTGDAMKQAKAPTTEIAATMAEARDSFLKAADTMGVPEQAAKDMADAFGLIPPVVTTDVKTNGLETEAEKAKAYGLELLGVPTDVATSLITNGFPEGTQEAQIFALTQSGIDPVVATMLVTQGIDEALTNVQGYAGQLGDIPLFRSTSIEAQTADANAQIAYLMQLVDGVPPEKAISVIAENTGRTTEDIAALVSVLDGMPAEKQTEISQMGAEDAQAAIAQYLLEQALIPGSKNTDVKVSGVGQAVGNVNTVQGAVDGMHGNTVTAGTKADTSGVKTSQSALDRMHDGSATAVTKADTSGARQAQAAVDGVKDRTVWITIKRTIVGALDGISGNAMGGLPAPMPILAGGGDVIGWTGFGPRKVDRIPAMLAAHEFVQPDWAVDYYGIGAMEALRRMIIPREIFQAYGFASGGSPTPAPTPSPLQLMDRHQLALAFYEGLQMGGYAVVPRADLSLMGGALS